MRDHACARPQLAHEPWLDALVERRTEVERDDSGGAEIRREEIALDELDEVGHSRGARAGIRFSDEQWIDFDPDTASPVLLRRGNHDPSVAGTEVVHDVRARDLGCRQHRVHDLRRRRNETDVGHMALRVRDARDGTGRDSERHERYDDEPYFAHGAPFSPIICRSGTTFTRSLTTRSRRHEGLPRRSAAARRRWYCVRIDVDGSAHGA